MEIPKIPPVEVPKSVDGGLTGTESRSHSSGIISPPGDLADIRPLDVAGALQILLAEVRAALESALEEAIGRGASNAQRAAIAPAGDAAPDPVQSAQEIVRMFLKSIPEDAGNAQAWSGTLMRVEAGIQSGMDRALEIVTQWRDVPPAATSAVSEALALVQRALGEETLNPIWLRPEWLGLAPAYQDFRRRRRTARRRLSDPDYPSGSLDDDGEEFPR
jgi:hypothetical protein